MATDREGEDWSKLFAAHPVQAPCPVPFLGEIVSTPYGYGTVRVRNGEVLVEFDDGSGCSLHEMETLVSETISR